MLPRNRDGVLRPHNWHLHPSLANTSVGLTDSRYALASRARLAPLDTRARSLCVGDLRMQSREHHLRVRPICKRKAAPHVSHAMTRRARIFSMCSIRDLSMSRCRRISACFLRCVAASLAACSLAARPLCMWLKKHSREQNRPLSFDLRTALSTTAPHPAHVNVRSLACWIAQRVTIYQRPFMLSACVLAAWHFRQQRLRFSRWSVPPDARFMTWSTTSVSWA